MVKGIFKYLLWRVKNPTLKISMFSEISLNSKIGKKVSVKSKSKIVNSCIGKNSEIEAGSVIANSELGESVKVGGDVSSLNSKFNSYSAIYHHSLIINSDISSFSYIAEENIVFNTTIGKFCSIGPRCIFGHGQHPVSRLSTSPFFYSKNNSVNYSFVQQDNFNEFAQIEVGNDVWIGANVYIKDGVKIGNGAIIGAGAVVTKDVGDYEIAVGVPAKTIKKRFSDEVIYDLLNLKWWNWDIETIKKKIDIFQLEDYSEIKMRL